MKFSAHRAFAPIVTTLTLATQLPLAYAQPIAAPAASVAAPISAAKKELISKLIQLQLPGIDGLSQVLLQQSLSNLAQGVRAAIQQVPADKRDAVAKAIDADVRKFVEETVPLLRERAGKLAAPSWTPFLDERFNEDELKQIIAWLEAPVSKKYQQAGNEMFNILGQKLSTEMRPVLETRFKALEQSIAKQLGLPPKGNDAASTPPAAPKPPAKK